ncbi:hypothetical protein [Motilimonas cestriensis]|uniref:hypothetical protein n=1 Tax=Motilimonas cestriensis TaxID=2742685 RepID=UPI003DA3FC4E
MINHVTRFTDAQQAWEQWNLAPFDHKLSQLQAFSAALQQGNATLAKVCQYQLEQGKKWLAQPHRLIGPTGETNELYTAGRGVALLILDNTDHYQQAQQSMMAMLSAALLAGNAVLLCSDDITFNNAVNNAMQQAQLPAHLLHIIAFDAYPVLLGCDIRSAGYIGSSQVELSLNLQLAKRDGVIVGLVSETDLPAMSLAHDPLLALRFITERTRTINITAVGGNATLLELGSAAH